MMGLSAARAAAVSKLMLLLGLVDFPTTVHLRRSEFENQIREIWSYPVMGMMVLSSDILGK